MANWTIWGGAAAAVLGGAVAVTGWQVHREAQEVQATAATISTRAARDFVAVRSLQTAVVRSELALYEHYSTNFPRATYLEKRDALRAGIDANWKVLEERYGGAQTTQQAQAIYQKLRAREEMLDEALTAVQVDWERARTLLYQASLQATQFSTVTDALAVTIEADLRRVSSSTEFRAAGLDRNAWIAFGGGVLIVLLGVGFAVQAVRPRAAGALRP